MFYVFLCFSPQVSGQTTYVFCVFSCFFLTSVEFDPSSNWGNHSMFYVFLCFNPRAQVTQPMCSMSFCVFFYQRLVWLYFRPGQPPNIFYVFLSFSTLVSGHTTHVFRVFLCFFLPMFSLILVKIGAPTQCVLCVFVVFFTTYLRANNLCFVCFEKKIVISQFSSSDSRLGVCKMVLK